MRRRVAGGSTLRASPSDPSTVRATSSLLITAPPSLTRHPASLSPSLPRSRPPSLSSPSHSLLRPPQLSSLTPSRACCLWRE
eukprot:3850526-Rhodomonas_salina.1